MRTRIINSELGKLDMFTMLIGKVETVDISIAIITLRSDVYR